MPTRELVSRDSRRMPLGGEDLEYVLVRRRGRRGVGLRVDENGLTVSAPSTLALAKVEAAVRDSERWVLRKVREWRARRVPIAQWNDGSRLPFLGGELVLRFAQDSRARVERIGDELRVRGAICVSEVAIRRSVIDWYRMQAKVHLAERVTTLCARAGIAPPRLIVSGAASRWGSCNSSREVRLAWRLIKAPARLVDYVVCHELAHLRHLDHSRAFWAEVERQCPDYRSLRRELLATDYLYRSF